MDVKTDLKQQEIKEINWYLDLITFPNKWNLKYVKRSKHFFYYLILVGIQSSFYIGLFQKIPFFENHPRIFSL